jgi:membrane protease YdiL (CAAX protease family)
MAVLERLPGFVPPPAPPAPIGGFRGSPAAFFLALVASVLAILSQYFLPALVPGADALYGTLLGDLLVVYGLPILAFATLVGLRPLQGALGNNGTAAVRGLRWYGLLSLLALVVSIALIIVYLLFDPGALKLLNQESPPLRAAASNPWFWVAFSFVIGGAEETIFRGWIFGYWLKRDPRRWVLHAAWTSLLFGGIHLYYAFTYAAAAPVVFETLFLIGFAFAATVKASGGNLAVVALLHGANDATAFLTIVSPSVALALHYGIIFAGAILGLVLYLRGRTPSAPVLVPPFSYPPTIPWPTYPPPPPPPTSPPPTMVSPARTGARGRPVFFRTAGADGR